MAKKIKKTEDIKQLLNQGLKDYVTEKGKKPFFIYQLVDYLQLAGLDFYDYYSSISELEQEVWKNYMSETIDRLFSEPVFQEYSGREKLLAFYFTWIEVLKEDESYTTKYAKKLNFLPGKGFLKGAKQVYLQFVNSVISQGKESGEIVNRVIISDQYDQAIWLQFLFLMKFWSTDASDDYEKTDAAIEKAVNATFDLFGRNPIDSIFDFGKFIVQNKNIKHFF
ncbi:MAG: TetR family transcriptional regulator C-terminal domain-containing protein [Bacteroidota bacterium]